MIKLVGRLGKYFLIILNETGSETRISLFFRKIVSVQYGIMILDKGFAHQQ